MDHIITKAEGSVRFIRRIIPSARVGFVGSSQQESFTRSLQGDLHEGWVGRESVEGRFINIEAGFRPVLGVLGDFSRKCVWIKAEPELNPRV